MVSTGDDGQQEAPLLIGEGPPGDAKRIAAPGGGVVRWAVVGLGLALGAVASFGLVLRPEPSRLAPSIPPSTATATQQVGDAASPDVDQNDENVVRAGSSEVTQASRRTVTSWSLPDGVWTWWPLKDVVVFVSAPEPDEDSWVFVHSKVSGRVIWSTQVAPGRVVVVSDPDTQDSVRFTMPASATPNPTAVSPTPASTDVPSPPPPLTLSADDGSLLAE